MSTTEGPGRGPVRGKRRRRRRRRRVVVVVVEGYRQAMNECRSVETPVGYRCCWAHGSSIGNDGGGRAACWGEGVCLRETLLNPQAAQAIESVQSGVRTMPHEVEYAHEWRHLRSLNPNVSSIDALVLDIANVATYTV